MNINSEFTEKRNKILIERKKEACSVGQPLLDSISDPGVAFVALKFIEHGLQEKCDPCRALLESANAKARSEMGY